MCKYLNMEIEKPTSTLGLAIEEAGIKSFTENDVLEALIQITQSTP